LKFYCHILREKRAPSGNIKQHRCIVMHGLQLNRNVLSRKTWIWAEYHSFKLRISEQSWTIGLILFWARSSYLGQVILFWPGHLILTGSSYSDRVILFRPSHLIRTRSSYLDRVILFGLDHLIRTGLSYLDVVILFGPRHLSQTGSSYFDWVNLFEPGHLIWAGSSYLGWVIFLSKRCCWTNVACFYLDYLP